MVICVLSGTDLWLKRGQIYGQLGTDFSVDNFLSTGCG